MLIPLYADSYVTLVLDDVDGIVRYTRSAIAFPSIDVLEKIHARLVEVSPTLPGRRLKLLLDARLAPPRNDEAFERVIGKALAGLLPRFVAHATLMKSAAGLLQARRLERERGAVAPSVFEDEASALEYLRRT
jgi:hypothetical protein